MAMKKTKFFRIFLLLSILNFPLLFASAECASGQFCNPIKGANSIEELLAKIIDVAVIILMPLVVLAIIYSGFMFLIARGNKEGLEKAKTNFVWVVIGVAVLLGAKLISAILKSTVDKVIMQ